MHPKFGPVFDEIRSKMPPAATLADLFEPGSLKEWVVRLVEKGGSAEEIRRNPAQWLEEAPDAQVRSTVTEALVAGHDGLADDEVRLILLRAMARCWARFSQQIKAALADAEAKKDAGLAQRLLQDYLDVQRKMKEFSRFYDEA
jgi:hypothetical protein